MKRILNGNIKNVFIAMLFFTIVLVSLNKLNLFQAGAFITGLCYRSSVKNRTQDLKDNLMDDHRKQEQNAQLDEARQRNAAKRAEMEAKYPELAKYNK